MRPSLDRLSLETLTQILELLGPDFFTEDIGTSHNLSEMARARLARTF